MTDSIFSEIPIPADDTEYYYIEFKVTNDFGCWNVNYDSIPVYQVQADFCYIT